MPYLKQIVNYLNTQLTETFEGEKFQPLLLSNVAITIQSDDKNGTHPILTEDFDNNKDLSYDDIYSLQIYHKLSGLTHTKQKQQYGNNNDNLISSYQMQMIVGGRRDKIRSTPEELESIVTGGLVSIIPKSVINPLKIQRCTITPAGSDMNQFLVWRDEYSRDYALPPNQLLFRIRYSIEMAYIKSCIECNC